MPEKLFPKTDFGILPNLNASQRPLVYFWPYLSSD